MTSSAPPFEIPPRFDPAATERELYARWESAGAFTARRERSERLGGDRTPFTIVIPPPNVTAVLHAGHGLNNTVQDVLVRWRRMAGDETLWVPGTDHAGIATQNVVERQLADEGQTRFDLGREAFVARTTKFVEETGGIILQQLRALGASCDWTRTAYTLSPENSHAVREAFVRLYEDGLIYRGHRVIHWCPRCMTSLSDEEAEFEETTGSLYHISYPLTSGQGEVTVATTRPETMLGDVAVAVNPDDERYRDIVGKTVRLPIANIDIPVIADAYADPAFGTGVVKITPAHDANDFEVGLRHQLPMPVVIDAEARMAEGADARGRVPESLRGLDRDDARKRIVEMLRAEGRLVKVEQHQHSVRHCYRCDTVVEPRLSDQWFVRMTPLAAPALEAVRDGRIRLLPERWEAVYINWLEGIRDWNISRQLWWGHRVPVWYCDACPAPNNVFASREDLTACPSCGGAVRQDEDVLDTWFSSWLWPIATLGWPNDESPDLAAFYPTDVLVTAPEILFFWVARMIMAGFKFRGEAPFHTVYLHGTVRDTQHRKMSKSLGNGIDPLDVIALYGADALRWTAIAGLGLGADVILDPADLERSFGPGRNFVTKLWNIGRFLLQNVGDTTVTPIHELDDARLTTADRWILSRLDVAIAECDAALGPARPQRSNDGRWTDAERRAGLRLNEYAESARRFVWNELADWYLESCKGRLTEGGADADVARAVLVHAFDSALRLLHPIVPFITEALWQRLPVGGEDGLLATAAWPRPRNRADNSTSAAEFELLREFVIATRQVRNDYAIAPSRPIRALLVPRSETGRNLETPATSSLVPWLARNTFLEIVGEAPQVPASSSFLSDGSEVVVPLRELVDVARECEKLKTELAQLEQQLTSLQARLSNEKFLAKARPDVVEAERKKAQEWAERRTQLVEKVAALCG